SMCLHPRRRRNVTLGEDMRTRRIWAGLAVAGTAVWLAGIEVPAASADSCSYDAAGKTVHVLHDAGFGLRLVRDGQARDWVPAFDPEQHGAAATVGNTDTIVFTDTTSGGGFDGINLSGGPFAPGATRELTGKSEIEILYDGGGRSSLTVSGSQTKRNSIV